MDLFKALCGTAGQENVFIDEPMNRHTTFRIGGPADYFVTADQAEQVGRIIKLCREENVPYYIIGNGSNLLVGDKGYRGVIIQIFKKMNKVRTEGERVYAQAGALLSKTASAALEASLTGLEFASGIPGTLGGALRMNAGAYGGEIKDILVRATLMDMDGSLFEFTNQQMQFGYRKSIAAEKNYIVLEADLALHVSSKEEVLAKMAELSAQRRLKQPLEYPSAGSTFKRPEGYFAGKLISDAGLKGFSVGGAQVSEKHAGFVINTGNATAADVIALTDAVRDKVFEKYGVKLELEIKQLG